MSEKRMQGILDQLAESRVRWHLMWESVMVTFFAGAYLLTRSILISMSAMYLPLLFLWWMDRRNR